MKTIVGLFALVCIAEAVFFEQYDPRPMDLAQLRAAEDLPEFTGELVEAAAAAEAQAAFDGKALEKIAKTTVKAAKKNLKTLAKAFRKA